MKAVFLGFFTRYLPPPIACLSLLLGFYGCAKPNVAESRAVYITIKTPNTAISQAGFIDSMDGGGYRLRIYAAGRAASEITAEDGVCEGGFCQSFESFNERYLSKFYPPNFLLNILGGHPIANLENSEIAFSKTGFEQSAKSPRKYNISYTADSSGRKFADTLNQIKIILRNSE